MGIPKFFRWCAERYPNVVSTFNDSPPPIDNLYLDMNGIIHNHSHPDTIDATARPPTTDEVVSGVLRHIDLIFMSVVPRKLFFMAIDGVAPRAKMNQQRQRRFRAATEAAEARAAAIKAGEDVPEESALFDSNAITPGTEFLIDVCEEIKAFVARKVTSDDAWRNCNVVFSGQEHPGEGEHKIVDYIRRRKSQPGYAPNEAHCMYGLDADLVMLSLATHEPHFVLLREVVEFSSKRDRDRRAREEALGLVADKRFQRDGTFILFNVNLLRELIDIDMRSKQDDVANAQGDSDGGNTQQVAVSTGDTFRPNPEAVFELERVIDDFIVMCFLIGNDFLPSIPTIAIADGAMTLLFDTYRAVVFSTGQHFACDGKLQWPVLQSFLAAIGEVEVDLVKARDEDDAKRSKSSVGGRGGTRDGHRGGRGGRGRGGHGDRGVSPAAFTTPQRRQHHAEQDERNAPSGGRSPVPRRQQHQQQSDNWREIGGSAKGGNRWGGNRGAHGAHGGGTQRGGSHLAGRDNEDDGDAGVGGNNNHNDLPSSSRPREGRSPQRQRANNNNGTDEGESTERPAAEKTSDDEEENDLYDDRDGRGHGHGFVEELTVAALRERLYRDKLKFVDPSVEGPAFLQRYVEGLQWVFDYYFQGPPSWRWYFPHHYAPLASDLGAADLSALGARVLFGPSEPFLPHQQLLAVLPPQSAALLPAAYRPLLTDEKSLLHPFIPSVLEVDREHARNPWEGVVLLPFLNETVLLAAYESVQANLTAEDKARNKRGTPVLFPGECSRDGSCGCLAALPTYGVPAAATTSVENGSAPPAVAATVVHSRLYPAPTKPYTAIAIDFPPLEGRFRPELCLGVRTGVDEFEGFSTTRTRLADFNVKFVEGVVSLFGNPTRKDSMLLCLPTLGGASAEEFRSRIGKVCFACWPANKRYLVSAIATRTSTISGQFDGNGELSSITVTRHTEATASSFDAEAEVHERMLLEKRGIEIRPVGALVFAYRLRGVQTTEDGRVIPLWSAKEVVFPLQLAVFEGEARFVPDAATRTGGTEATLREGDRVLCLDQDSVFFSRPGVVLATAPSAGGASSSERVTVRFAPVVPEMPMRLLGAATTFCDPANWMTLEEMANLLRLSFRTVSQICSSVTLSKDYGEVDIGLQLKFNSKNLARVGFCKLVQRSVNPAYASRPNIFAKAASQADATHYYDTRGNNNQRAQNQHPGGRGADTRGQGGPGGVFSPAGSGHGTWYVTQLTMRVVQAYCELISPLVAAIEADRDFDTRSVDPSSLMTGAWAHFASPAEAMVDVLEFVSESVPWKTAPLIEAFDDALPVDLVAALEAGVAAATTATAGRFAAEAEEVVLPRAALYASFVRLPAVGDSLPHGVAGGKATTVVPALMPTCNRNGEDSANYAVGDRVVYARTFGRVPFGMRGTIVRVLGDCRSAEVVFDQVLSDGDTLSGRLQTTRGALCKLGALLVLPTRREGAFEIAEPAEHSGASTAGAATDMSARRLSRRKSAVLASHH